MLGFPLEASFAEWASKIDPRSQKEGCQWTFTSSLHYNTTVTVEEDIQTPFSPDMGSSCTDADLSDVPTVAATPLPSPILVQIALPVTPVSEASESYPYNAIDEISIFDDPVAYRAAERRSCVRGMLLMASHIATRPPSHKQHNYTTAFKHVESEAFKMRTYYRGMALLLSDLGITANLSDTELDDKLAYIFANAGSTLEDLDTTFVVAYFGAILASRGLDTKLADLADDASDKDE